MPSFLFGNLGEGSERTLPKELPLGVVKGRERKIGAGLVLRQPPPFQRDLLQGDDIVPAGAVR